VLGEMIVTCSIIGTRGPLLQVALILTKSPIERAFLFSPLLATTPVHPLPRLARRPGANPDHQSFTAFALATKTTRCEATVPTTAKGRVG